MSMIGAASAVTAFSATTRDIRASSLSSLCATSLLRRFVDHQHVDVIETTLDSPCGVTTVAQAFFQSPTFQFERALLRVAGYGDISDEAIRATNFDVGDKVVVFRVVERAPDQILFCWNDFMDVNGYTWLSVASDGRTVQFGSTFDTEKHWHRFVRPFFNHLVVPLHLWNVQLVLSSTKRALEHQMKQRVH